jgi:hypothetical protein
VADEQVISQQSRTGTAGGTVWRKACCTSTDPGPAGPPRSNSPPGARHPCASRQIRMAVGSGPTRVGGVDPSRPVPFAGVRCLWMARHGGQTRLLVGVDQPRDGCPVCAGHDRRADARAEEQIVQPTGGGPAPRPEARRSIACPRAGAPRRRAVAPWTCPIEPAP